MAPGRGPLHADFLRFYVLDNHVLRFLGQRAFVEDDVPLSLAAFLLATATLFGPWSIFLPAAAARLSTVCGVDSGAAASTSVPLPRGGSSCSSPCRP